MSPRAEGVLMKITEADALLYVSPLLNYTLLPRIYIIINEIHFPNYFVS